MATKHGARPRSKANLSAELQKECTAILDLLANEEDEHWQIGVHYNRIVDGRLAQADGFKDAREFISQRVGGVSHGTVELYGAIARAFSEDAAKKYGSTKLGALLTYEKLTHVNLPSKDPGQVTIKVPNPNGSTTEKHFADCSREELKSAIRKLHRPPKPIPVDDRRVIGALQKTLEQQLGSSEAPISMHARRGPADTFVVFNLPVNYLEPLRDVLDIVFRKPENIVEKRRPQWHPQRSKDATWRVRNGRSRVQKRIVQSEKSVPPTLSTKARQLRSRSRHVTRR